MPIQVVKTPSGESVHLKKSYTIEDKHEYIYTGGAIHFSNDEAFMLTACEETVKVTDLGTGKVLNTLEGDGEVVTCLILVPNTDTCVVASRSGQLYHWNYVYNELIKSFKSLDGPIASMCWDPTFTHLATGASNGNVKVWDFAHTAVTHSFKGSQGIVFCMAFHPDPKRMWLATSASADCDVKVWDLFSKKLVHNMDAHVSPVQGLTFSEDGKYVVSGGRDRTMNVWRVSDHSFKLHSAIPMNEAVEGLKILPCASTDVGGEQKKSSAVQVVTVGDGGMVKVWDVLSGECIRASSPHNQLTDVSLLPISHRVVIVNGNMDIVFLCEDTLKVQRRVVGYNDEIIDAKYIDDDHVLVIANSESARVIQLSTHDCAMLEGHDANVLCADVSPCGNFVVTSSKDNSVRIWQKHTGEHGISFQPVAIGMGHNDGVSACAFNRKKNSITPDGPTRNFVVSAGQDLTVKLWNVLGMNGEKESEVVLSPAMTVKAHDKDINTVAVAPNDRMFVTGSHDRLAKLWSTQDLSLIGTLRGHKRGIWHAEFSPVDRCVATASGDKTIKLWSITDFTCLKTLEGHTGGVLKVAFMSRGMQMASSAADGLCKVWTLKTNECEETMDGHTDKVWALTLSKDESRIVTGGGDAVLNIWNDTTAESQEAEAEKEEEKIRMNQELMNLVQNKQYLKAAKLALRLDQPHRMRTLMEEILESGQGEAKVGKVVAALDDMQTSKLLGYIREWNTNARHSRVAQLVLSCLLKSMPPSRIVKLDKIKSLIEGLLPYSQRHFSRLDRLEQQSFFVDYTWQGLRYGMVGNAMEVQHMGTAIKTINDDDKDFLHTKEEDMTFEGRLKEASAKVDEEESQCGTESGENVGIKRSADAESEEESASGSEMDQKSERHSKRVKNSAK
eukprot:CFRG0074T1